MSSEPHNAAQFALPSRLEIFLSLRDQALAGGWVFVDLPMYRKNSYRLFFGPTDDDGLVVITREELAEQARKTNNFFVMDYVGLGPDWTGEVSLRPVNLQAIEQVRTGFATWESAGFYPSDFLEQMDALEQRLTLVPADTKLKLALLSDPGGNSEIRLFGVPASESG
jgi:hypothetical protein